MEVVRGAEVHLLVPPRVHADHVRHEPEEVQLADVCATRRSRPRGDAGRQYGTDNDANLLGQIKAKSKGKVKFNNIDSAAFQKAAIPIAKSIAKLVGDEAFVNAVMKAIQ